MHSQIPKRALRFLRWYCREDFLEEIEGDLLEIFDKMAEDSLPSARRAFIIQVLLHFRPDFIRSFRLSNSIIDPEMIKHYFKIAWRNLAKQKLYSFINIGGLSIGLSCFLLFFIYWQHEHSYDQFYENADAIYRVYQKMEGNESQGSDLYAYTPVGLASTMLKDYPEVAHASTLRDREWLLSEGRNNFFEKGLSADQQFFKVFKHPLIQGDPSQVLSDPNNIVLSASLARKIFGYEDPIGKAVKVQNSRVYNVSGVFADLPKNSSIQCQFVTSILASNQYQRELKEDRWSNNDYYTFFTLKPETEPTALSAKLPLLVDQYLDLGEDFPFKIHYLMQPMKDFHFARTINSDMGIKGNKQYTNLLFLIACIVLLLACVNYMSLAIARSLKRGLEVGLRKVVGARKKQLIEQFLGESILIAFLGFLIAIGATLVLLQPFGVLLERPLELNLAKQWLFLPALFLLILLVGILAGSYPAFLMSTLKPIQVIKGKVEGKFSDIKVQRFLLVGQYATSIILIISSLVIYLQFSFIQKKELGYDKDHILTIRAHDFQVREQFSQLKTMWENNPNILEVTAASELPTNIDNSTLLRKENSQENIPFYRARVDEHYLDVFGLELIAGRNFSEERGTDESEARIINETAAKVLGWSPEEALGKTIGWITPKTIIGVVKDFHMHSMHTAIAPLQLQMRGPYFSDIAVKINAGRLEETISFLESSLKEVSPYPFDYSFLDERFNRLYQADQKTGQLFLFFTILSIFIASLGLFGLAALAAQRRTKEIGIRKVLGASVNNIVGLLSKDFLLMVLIGFFVAVPIAWYGMQYWLSDFAYHIKLRWWIFLGAGLIATLIAFITVSAHALRAAFFNPVQAIKND